METCQGCFESIVFSHVGTATAWTFDREPACQYTESGLHEPVTADVRPLHEVLQEYMDNVLATGVGV